MLKAAIGLFLAAIVAGALGFTGWAGTFTSLAVLAFYLFLGLAAIALLASFVSGATHSPVGAGGLLVTAALIGAGVYWWLDHDMTGEKLGRTIDRTAFELKEGAGQAVRTASSETSQLMDEVGDEAKEAAHRVEAETDGVESANR